MTIGSFVFWIVVFVVIGSAGYLIVFKPGTKTVEFKDWATVVGVAVLLVGLLFGYNYLAGVPEPLQSRRTTLFRATSTSSWQLMMPSSRIKNLDANQLKQDIGDHNVTKFEPEAATYKIQGFWIPVKWYPNPKFYTLERVVTGKATLATTVGNPVTKEVKDYFHADRVDLLKFLLRSDPKAKDTGITPFAPATGRRTYEINELEEAFEEEG